MFLRRFNREADTLANLNHPNIVHSYGLETDGSHVFILMDYVDGWTLRKEIAASNDPLPIKRIREIMIPVSSALSYAHHKKKIHCDIKPANIMIHKNGTILLADFGIAREAEGATTTTLAGAGTPAYMAPEQAREEKPTPQTICIHWVSSYMKCLPATGRLLGSGQQSPARPPKKCDGSTSIFLHYPPQIESTHQS